jgi:hypothetical protein
MFWNKKKQREASTESLAPTFEMAKEATRRAAFLNTASRMPGGAANARDLATLFRVCRSVAISAGAAVGQSQAQVDAAIATQCDADFVRLKAGSEEEMREFSRESGEIVKAFLATLDEKTLAAAAKG